ncbi:ketoacyl-ACP synthase III [bacterium]|nr:MAG: ketoacyl-ACP synthase III [bacterium]
MAPRSVLLGIGSNAPANIVTNDDMSKRMDTSDEWIVQRTGIKERRMGLAGSKWSDFVVPACEKALEMAGVKAEELDYIIAGTLTADMYMPSGGCTLQMLLGAKKAAGFTVAAACSGFVYGLTIADRFIRCEPNLKILVVGAEMVSQRIDWEERSTAVLFGDGGGAAVLTGSRPEDGNRGILASRIHSDGTKWGLLYIPGGGTEHPAYDGSDPKAHTIHMRGNEIFKIAIKSMAGACEEVLADAGLSGNDVDWVVPHQANIRIIEMVAKEFGIPMEKVIINVQRYGNTSAGTIPLAFDEAVRDGRIKRGQTVLMPVFGGGLTWGATLLRW